MLLVLRLSAGALVLPLTLGPLCLIGIGYTAESNTRKEVFYHGRNLQLFMDSL